MANKTLRLLMHVNSDDQTTVSLDIAVNNTDSIVSVNHTTEWILLTDKTGATFVDLLVDAPVLPQGEGNLPVADISITPIGGSILLVGYQENYNSIWSDNPDYDVNDITSEEYILTQPGSEDVFTDSLDIVAPPTINGEEDVIRCDFSVHWGGGNGGGVHGPGSFPIYNGETASLKIQYSFYHSA
jgi:hypothetical protein